MTRVFMVVLHSSACVKAEEREGVVRLSRSPIPRFGRIPNPPGNCPPPASHDAGCAEAGTLANAVIAKASANTILVVMFISFCRVGHVTGGGHPAA
jgi:hypothetical protein